MAEKLTVEEILEIARQAVSNFEAGSGGQFGLLNPMTAEQIEKNKAYLKSSGDMLNPVLESAFSKTRVKQRPDLMAQVLNVATPRLTTAGPGMGVRKLIADEVLLGGMLPKNKKPNINSVKQLAKIISDRMEERKASNFGGAQGLWT
tara:strand:+ start:261 stop:701 length:441 start_codon:yes stop_codon:yes gene_type:complete